MITKTEFTYIATQPALNNTMATPQQKQPQAIVNVPICLCAKDFAAIPMGGWPDALLLGGGGGKNSGQ